MIKRSEEWRGRTEPRRILNLRRYAGRALRYALVGVGNTIFGLALIYTLDLGLHVPPTNANAIGYAVCIVISFIMSRSFVFQSTGRVGVAGLRYMVVVLIAFLLNQAVLRLALLGLGEGVWQHAAAQLSGMACYTAFTFLGCQLWVFRSQAGKD